MLWLAPLASSTMSVKQLYTCQEKIRDVRQKIFIPYGEIETRISAIQLEQPSMLTFLSKHSVGGYYSHG